MSQVVKEVSDVYNAWEGKELPTGWELVRLGDVLKEVVIRASDYKLNTEEIPILSLTKDRGLILQTERFDKRVATSDVSRYKVIEKGQLAYNPYVLWEGAVHALRDRDCGLVSPVYLTWQCTEADFLYLDYLLKTSQLINTYLRLCSGAVKRRRSINKTTFVNINIPLPPIHEQKAIAHILNTVQRAKEATEQVIQATKELKKSLMRFLFTYGPVPIEEAENVPLKETEIGMVPEDWQLVRLGDIAQLKNGVNFSKDQKGHGFLTVDVLNMYSDCCLT